jgi:hypothetical protein
MIDLNLINLFLNLSRKNQWKFSMPPRSTFHRSNAVIDGGKFRDIFHGRLL